MTVRCAGIGCRSLLVLREVHPVFALSLLLEVIVPGDAQSCRNSPQHFGWLQFDIGSTFVEESLIGLSKFQARGPCFRIESENAFVLIAVTGLDDLAAQVWSPPCGVTEAHAHDCYLVTEHRVVPQKNVGVCKQTILGWMLKPLPRPVYRLGSGRRPSGLSGDGVEERDCSTVQETDDSPGILVGPAREPRVNSRGRPVRTASRDLSLAQVTFGVGLEGIGLRFQREGNSDRLGSGGPPPDGSDQVEARDSEHSREDNH